MMKNILDKRMTSYKSVKDLNVIGNNHSAKRGSKISMLNACISLGNPFDEVIYVAKYNS